MTLLMFLVLAAYYMLKTAREVFILTEGGAEVKSYSSAGQAILLLARAGVRRVRVARQPRAPGDVGDAVLRVQPGAVHRWRRRPDLRVGIVYFLWVGIFNVMVIAQFWAFANDIYTPEQGKRLFPLIGVGSSLGAWVGSVRAGDLVSTQRPDAAADRRRRASS